jgi:hypothetical protein
MANRNLIQDLSERLSRRRASKVTHARTNDELRRSVDTAMTLAGESTSAAREALAAAARR